MTNTHDPFDLNRFVKAQQSSFERALSEMNKGKKSSHWIWYIFPQLRGLGYSFNAQYYGISGLDEAQAYTEHPILGPRLITISEAALAIEGRTVDSIFGFSDNIKLCSSATLFTLVSKKDSVFHHIINKYFDGWSDKQTLAMLQIE